MRGVVEGVHGGPLVVLAHDADERGDAAGARVAHGREHLVDGQGVLADVRQDDLRPDRPSPSRVCWFMLRLPCAAVAA